MLINSSSVSNYGTLTISNLHQPLLDANSYTSATFANYGNVKLSASNVAVQVRTFNFGGLDIASDSILSLESDVSFQNGSIVTVAGTLKVADGAKLGIFHPFSFRFCGFVLLFLLPSPSR
jgi:hypothetical protein